MQGFTLAAAAARTRTRARTTTRTTTKPTNTVAQRWGFFYPISLFFVLYCVPFLKM